MGIEINICFRTDCFGCLDGADIDIQTCSWTSDPRRQGGDYLSTGFCVYVVQRRDFFGDFSEAMVANLAEQVREQVFWCNDANIAISEAAVELQEYVDDIAAEWQHERHMQAA